MIPNGRLTKGSLRLGDLPDVESHSKETEVLKSLLSPVALSLLKRALGVPPTSCASGCLVYVLGLQSLIVIGTSWES